MKPVWDKMVEEYSANNAILVADIDCIGDGKKICDDAGIQGFPTIKVIPPPPPKKRTNVFFLTKN